MFFGNGFILFLMLLGLYCLICDSTNISKSESKSKIKGKIVNGESVDIKEYPFAAQFLNVGRLCGGVIIHIWALITAAHCVEVNTDLKNMIIIAGNIFFSCFSTTCYCRSDEVYKLRHYILITALCYDFYDTTCHAYPTRELKI